MKILIFGLSNALALISSVEDAFNFHVTDTQVSSHGCHCRAFDGNGVFLRGEPLDNRDKACKQWNQTRKCLFLEGGPCFGSPNDVAYDGANSCSSLLDNCAKELCMVDNKFGELVESYSNAIINVGANELNLCAGEREIVGDRKCCGVDGVFQMYEIATHVCDDNEISSRARPTTTMAPTTTEVCEGVVYYRYTTGMLPLDLRTPGMQEIYYTNARFAAVNPAIPGREDPNSVQNDWFKKHLDWNHSPLKLSDGRVETWTHSPVNADGSTKSNRHLFADIPPSKISSIRITPPTTRVDRSRYSGIKVFYKHTQTNMAVECFATDVFDATYVLNNPDRALVYNCPGDSLAKGVLIEQQVPGVPIHLAKLSIYGTLDLANNQQCHLTTCEDRKNVQKVTFTNPRFGWIGLDGKYDQNSVNEWFTGDGSQSWYLAHSPSKLSDGLDTWTHSPTNADGSTKGGRHLFFDIPTSFVTSVEITPPTGALTHRYLEITVYYRNSITGDYIQCFPTASYGSGYLQSNIGSPLVYNCETTCQADMIIIQQGLRQYGDVSADIHFTTADPIMLAEVAVYGNV